MSHSPLVAVVDHRFPDLDIEREVLGAVGAEVVDLAGADLDQVMQVSSSADGILLGARLRFDADAIRKLRHCRIIARFGVGFDNVDLDAARQQGIVVTNVPDYCIEEVANHAMALMLSVHRRLFEYDRAMRSGEPAPPRAIPRLSNCTLGVFGFGRIGQEVVRRATAFGMRILVHDPYAAPSRIESMGARASTLDEVLASADLLTLHLPLTAKTRHILDADAFAAMHPGVIVINVSRGALIDESALAQAIESGHIGGAGLDVTEVEPLPTTSTLLDLPRVVLTPHVAYLSDEAIVELRRKAAEEVANVLGGLPPRYSVMPDADLQFRLTVD